MPHFDGSFAALGVLRDQMPEVVPEPVTPEIKKDAPVPIDVINGALEEIRRQEEEGGDDEVTPPTLH